MSRIHMTGVDVFYSGPGFFRSAYTGNPALIDINLNIQSGDRLGLIGQNGSGKTTLLRTMAGIYLPTHGSVEVEGRISSMLSLGLGVQMEYSGYRNINLALILAGVPKQDRPRLRDQIAEFSELGDFLHQPLRNYSSGMAMRLKFSCATAIRPDVLLLDEWLGAGDSSFKDKAAARMTDLVSEAGIVVLATHNLWLMKTICNKAAWMVEGRIAAYGDIEDVIAQEDHFTTTGEYPDSFYANDLG